MGALLKTGDGSLWVGFDSGGVARLEAGRWRFQPDLAAFNTFRLAETTDAAGTTALWALTIDAGLLRYQGDDRWLPAEERQPLPRALTDIVVTRELGGSERFWVSSVNGGLWYREPGGAWQRYAGGFGDVQINDLHVTRIDGREQLWVATFGEGLWRIDTEGQRVWNTHSGELPSDMLYALEESRADDGSTMLWIGSRAGLMRTHGERLSVFDYRYGLPSNAVRGLSV